MATFMNLAGERFGRLRGLTRDLEKGRPVRWMCQCDCGVVLSVLAGSLRSGGTQSCGCLHKERTSAANSTHRLSNTPEFRTWAKMLDRCSNPNTVDWPDYGGRGIVVCERWLNSFESFYADMGPKPSAKHSVERANNSGPYSPENCRWATPKEQANNRRTNHPLTLNGTTQNISAWSAALGMGRAVIGARLRLGWSIEEALTTPVGQRRPSRKISPEPT